MAFRQLSLHVVIFSNYLTLMLPVLNKLSDFLIPGPPRISIECKANPTRDWDRTTTFARLLRTELPCDRVLVAIPDDSQVPDRSISGFDLVQINQLPVTLIQLLN